MPQKLLDSETVGDVTISLYAVTTDGTSDTLTYTVTVKRAGRVVKENTGLKYRSTADRMMQVAVTGARRGRY